MADASRCPVCRARVHPYAATCPSCGADLDAYRRRNPRRSPRLRGLRAPSLGNDTLDLLVPALIMLLLALFAPLYGAILALFIVWHSNRHGLIARRNVAIGCAALAILNLFAPNLIEARLV